MLRFIYKNMQAFKEISVEEWNETLAIHGLGNVFMNKSWESAVSAALPYVSYRHFRYHDTHLVRVAMVNSRNTTSPFSDGGDVIALSQTPLDLVKFQADVISEFGSSVRLRVDGSHVSVIESESTEVVASEHVVSLQDELLSKVRKTLRHILSKSVVGEFSQSNNDHDIDTAYRLYVKHMRRVNNFAIPKRLFISLLHDHKADLWIWRFQSKVHAMAIFIPNDKEVLYSLSAADELAFKKHAPHHLVYNALLFYKKNEIYRAMLGATGKGSALEVFKRGWRGDEYCIFALGERSTSIKKTSLLRSLVKFVPLPLYPLLTTKLGKYLL